jgi:hypothetical protein
MKCPSLRVGFHPSYRAEYTQYITTLDGPEAARSPLVTALKSRLYTQMRAATIGLQALELINPLYVPIVLPMSLHKPKVLYALLLAGLLSIPLKGQNSDAPAARSKVLALEHAWNQAEAFKDIKAMDFILDASLVYVDSDGSLLNKAEFLAHVKSAHLRQVTTQSMTVQIFENTAIVTGTYQAVDFKDGKDVVLRGRFIDTWALRDSTWVCVAAQSTPIRR